LVVQTTDRAEGGVIEARRLQRSFRDGLIAEEIEDLREAWMRHVDMVLRDEVIVSAVHQALSSRYPNSRSHGRPGYPAEVVLRLLILKHVRNFLELCGLGARSPGQSGP
jgi:IS5 family transposase